METQFTKGWETQGYTMDSKQITCGSNARQNINDLPQAQGEMDKFDCSIVVTMLKVKNKRVFASRRIQRQVQTCASSVGCCVDTNDLC